ncbi:MAG: methylenetetrahydrofolate reductase [NAD(P)H] [Eubacterium sp.]|nr:methylenetetrahydrofolate reductase [NAD(P)H] [Eubacterium sp.]
MIEKNGKKIEFSCEVFPPKRNEDMYEIYKTLDELKLLGPDFISVTYGAGGSNSKKTSTIASYIENICEVQALAHVTAAGVTPEKLADLMAELKKKNVNRILALRGDKPRDMTEEEFEARFYKHASDLIEVINQDDFFRIAAACYPEKHPEALTVEEDIRFLKKKVDMGADDLISQMFFDNDKFYSFLERLDKAGVKASVHAGIMPITAAKQLGTSVSLSGSSIPTKLSNLIAKYAEDPVSLKKAGIEYAINQVEDLIDHGVNGIHIYCMNKSDVTREIYEAII